ncbi:MAG TPA: bacillithiol biosynthesis cysteine-adding enzyme BshC [Polyangia bacterium]|nr:bacillithiol biosynthesis cysteine-adding enzyme BshC [Polyangia bacterium]
MDKSTPSLNFSAAFLAGDPRALAFLPASFRDPKARLERARERAWRQVPPRLLELLHEQDRALPPSEARRRHIDALGRPGTLVVATGQQVGLFLGPLYTFYKAASAVALARAIEAESGLRTVPLFWLQTEDHDFPEVDHCHVLRPGGESVRLTLRDEAAGQPEAGRVSLAHRRLGEDVRELVVALEQALEERPHAAEFLALVREHYQPGRTLPAAFAGLLASLFAEEGLIVFDPRAAPVARLAASIYHRAIVSADAVAEKLLERVQALRAAGFTEQVHVRPGSPLVFFHEHAATGPRYRLERHGQAWTLVGRGSSAGAPGQEGHAVTIGADELLTTLDADPLRFSTSALLRPIVQDTLLPTVAYVGGPGEINYFAQLGPLYDFFDLVPPLVVPRARFRCIDARTRSLLGRFGLTPRDAERPREELVQSLAAAALPAGLPAPDPLSARLLADFSRELEAFSSGLSALTPPLDPKLADAVRRTRGTAERAVERLVARYRRALGARTDLAGERIERLTGFLFPGGEPQERHYSLAYFVAQMGVSAFKAEVLRHLDPYDPAVRDIDL